MADARPAPAERRDRRPARVPRPVRSPLFLASTIVLTVIAMLVALAPIAVRYLDRQTVTRIAVVSTDADLAQRAVAVADSLLNIPPAGADPAAWEKPFQLELIGRREAAAETAHGRRATSAGVMVVRATAERPGRRRSPDERRANGARSQLLSVAAFGIGVLDWSARLPADDARDPFSHARLPRRVDQHGDRGRRPLDPQQAASRDLLGIVFVDPAAHHDRHLRDVGRDGRGRREEQPGDGADDQRRVAAPDADRQGRRDRGGRADPVRRDRDPGPRPARPPGSDRDGDPRSRLGQRRAAGRADAGAARRLRRVLPARVRAVRADLRGDGLVRQPAGRPPDAVAAAEPGGDGRLPDRDRRARRRGRGMGHRSRRSCRRSARS